MHDATDHPIAESEAAFPGAGETLFRRSVRPMRDPWASLCIVHGYGDHGGRYLHFMRWMARRGVACHTVDLRGQGRATGRRGFVRGWEEYLDDLDAFVALPEVRSTNPAFLLGHSHGGLVVAAWVERNFKFEISKLRFSGCVLTAPFFAQKLHVPAYKRWIARLMNPLLPWLRVSSGLSDAMLSSDQAMLAESRADPLLARAATPRWYIASRAAQARVLADAKNFRLPLLLLFGDADPVADLAAATAFFNSAGSENKTLTVFPDLLHEILRETAREQVFASILDWMRTAISPSPAVG